jgi:hypothetical protein
MQGEGQLTHSIYRLIAVYSQVQSLYYNFWGCVHTLSKV